MKTPADKLAKILRVVTLAPLMALVILCILYILRPELFGGALEFGLAVLFLTVFPLLGYPLQPITPYFRKKGREGQRNLAMIFAVVGYIAGCITALCMDAPYGLRFIYFSYLFSGVLLVGCNKICGLRASGHTCGIMGPFALLAVFGQPWALLGAPVLAAACWASLHMKRHTAIQLAAGALVPLIALLPAALLG